MGLIGSDIEMLEDSPIVDVWRMGYGNPDVVAMFAGESDVPTPSFICDATSKALAAGRTFYTPNRGIPAVRDALIAYNKRIYGIDLPDHRITLTSSGMSAVMLIAQATAGPGDNVVAITPSWPNILRAMQINGAEPREVAMTAGTVVLLPFGALGASHVAGRPGPLLLAFGVAMLASVVPYTLEFAAMRRAPRRVFGILLSLDPALATLAGWLLLRQHSSPVAIAAVAVVITASVGSTLSAREPPSLPWGDDDQ